MPRVGGIGIVAGVLLAFALVRAEPLLAALVAVLAVISYLDDRAHLPIALRFGAHAAAAVVFVLATTPDLHPLWQAVLALATMWVTNLYNFMDGSDGLAGGMALFGFGAYALAAWLAGDRGVRRRGGEHRRGRGRLPRLQLPAGEGVHGGRRLDSARLSRRGARHPRLARRALAALVPGARLLAVHRRREPHARAPACCAARESGGRTARTTTSAWCSSAGAIATPRSPSTR